MDMLAELNRMGTQIISLAEEHWQITCVMTGIGVCAIIWMVFIR